MNRSQAITYIIGIITFLIPIKLYLTQPTDFDGGPMLVYNFLFFYPLLLLSVVLSIVLIFRLKSLKKMILPKTLVILSTLPSLFLTAFVAINIVSIANEPETLDIPLPSQSINIIVNDTLEIKIHGSTKRTLNQKEEIIHEKKVNIVPYINGIYSFKDGGELISQTKDQNLYYENRNDSLIIYTNKYDFTYFNKTRISLPFKIETIKNDTNIKQLKKYNWKRNYH